jgi:hypothetical protein
MPAVNPLISQDFHLISTALGELRSKSDFGEFFCGTLENAPPPE